VTNARTRSAAWHRLRLAAGVAFSVVIVAACFLTARRLTTTGWPLQDANVVLVVTASAAYLSSFFLRALGWQRLFVGERPDRSRCLAACGAAAASGVVLPFRLDYVVKVWTLRRLGGVRLGLDTIGLSILTLGMVDAVAMFPLAVSAFALSDSVFRGPLVVVLLFCMGCITALVLVSVVLIRALTELTGQAWIAELITSGIFLIAGAFLMLKGASSAERDLEKS